MFCRESRQGEDYNDDELVAIRQIGNILQSRDQSLSGDNILAVVEEGEHPYDYLFGDRKPSAVAMKMRNVLRE